MSRPSGVAPSTTSRVHRAVAEPDAAAPLFTVSQAAAMLEMQPAFIRRLDDTEGIVCPARTGGGQRRYSRVELGHIAALAALMSEGMTLTGAQRIIELENEVAELRRQRADHSIVRSLPALSAPATTTVIDLNDAGTTGSHQAHADA